MICELTTSICASQLFSFTKRFLLVTFGITSSKITNITEIQKNHFNECKTFFIRIHNPYNPPFYKFETTFIIGIIIETYTTITNVATKP